MVTKHYLKLPHFIFSNFPTGKVNIPATNIPPGVTNLMPAQYLMGNPSLFYNQLQAPMAAYSAYGTTGLEDMAALQRNASLHTLVGSGAAAAAAAAGQQQAANSGLVGSNPHGSHALGQQQHSAAATAHTHGSANSISIGKNSAVRRK